MICQKKFLACPNIQNGDTKALNISTAFQHTHKYNVRTNHRSKEWNVCILIITSVIEDIYVKCVFLRLFKNLYYCTLVYDETWNILLEINSEEFKVHEFCSVVLC